MSDNIEDRADDLAIREAQAGGPEALVASLVSGFKRQRRLLRYTMIGLVADIVLSVVLIPVVFATHDTAGRSETNSTTIARLVYTQQAVDWRQCERSRTNTAKINSTDLAFVAFIKSLPPSPTAAGRARLVAFENIYRSATLNVPTCGPEPAPPS